MFFSQSTEDLNGNKKKKEASDKTSSGATKEKGIQVVCNEKHFE